MNAYCLRVAVVVVAASLLAGCASFTPKIGKDEKPTANDAYLYGRFSMDATYGRLSFAGHQTMGFSIKCGGERSYLLRFSKDDPLQIVKIAPSTCSLVEFVYTDADGMIKSRKPAPPQLMRDAVFAAGKAYYLGDFYAEANSSVSYNMIHMNWRITAVKEDYEKTTQEMKAGFPNLVALPTENRMMGKAAK